MPKDIPHFPHGSSERADRPVVIALFLLALCVYLLTAAGHIVSEDGTQMYNTTRSIVRDGDFSIPWGHAMEGRDGKLYSRYGIALSLVATPFYAAGWALSAAGPALARENPDFVERFAVSMTSPVIGALFVALVFALGRAVGYAAGTSVFLALAFGFSTFFWAGAKYFVSEPLQGLFLAAALLVLIRSGGMRPRSLAIAGFLLGLGFLAKPATAVLYPAYGAVVLWGRGGPRPFSSALGRLVAFSAPFAAAGLLSVAYNYYRYGEPLEFGFGFQDPRQRAFSTPLAKGLYGLLFSSGKGLFLYAPLTLLSLFSFRSFYRRSARAATLCLLVPAALVLFHAKWVAWHGDGFWGPRYVLPAVAFLILPAGSFLEDAARRAKWRTVLACALLAAGVAVQAGGVTISYASYFREAGVYPYKKPFYDPDFMKDVHFSPSHSPVLGHWRMLARIARGEEGWNKISLGGAVDGRVPVGEGDADEFRRGLDIWYVHFYRAGVPPVLFGWMPALLTVAALALGVRLRTLLAAKGGGAVAG
jgi:hypothetical protein